MLKDLKHAGRLLLHAKGWTSVVLLSLALGIGANTAVFSALNGLLFTELHVKDPASLVRLRYAGRNDMVTSSSDYGFSERTASGEPVRTTFSYAMYQQLVASNQTMSGLVAGAPYSRVNLVIDGQPELASAFMSSGNFYELLGVRARLGRPIQPADDMPSASPVAMISSKYWHTRFLTDPAIVGKTVRANNVLVTIVGVIEPEFTGVQRTGDEPPDIAFPLSLEPQLNTFGPSRISQPTTWWLLVIGRLKPGVTAAQVQGNLDGVFQSTARAGLDAYLTGLAEAERGTAVNRSRTHVPRLHVDSGRRGVYDVATDEIRTATILAVVVGLVLLIVCANVANLLLSRATARHRELSVRLSLGATRGRLIRQLLTESLLLASAGGALGIMVAYWGRALLPGGVNRAVLLDWRVLAFVLLVTLVTGIVFGIAPALRATGHDVNTALKGSGRGIAVSRSLLGKSLLVTQVAISLVLLVGAGLFLRTLHNLRHVDVGFNPENLLLFRIQPQLNRYDEKKTAALYGQLLDRIAAVPGVRAAGLSNPPLLSGSVNSTNIFIDGRAYANPREGSGGIHRLVVSPNFFDVMGIPIVAGRGFSPQDDEAGPKVVVINQTAARKYFPDVNPIGLRFGSSLETRTQLEIVGVLRDTKYNSVREPVPPTMYVPYLQTRTSAAAVVVRTSTDPTSATSAVREAVRQVDPNLPMVDVSTQMEQVERRFQQEKMFARTYTLFGVLALVLAAIGLFGVMSYSVSRRTNEIGVRMALGAQRSDVLRLVMGESMVLVCAGVLIGVSVALATGRFVATLLYGIPATDSASVVAAVTIMVAVSALAAFLPARRAARVDPMVALRYD